MCNQQLTNIPSQKYRISSVCNKIYDITERKVLYIQLKHV